MSDRAAIAGDEMRPALSKAAIVGLKAGIKRLRDDTEVMPGDFARITNLDGSWVIRWEPACSDDQAGWNEDHDCDRAAAIRGDGREM